MSLFIKNLTGSNVDIDDLGITIPGGGALDIVDQDRPSQIVASARPDGDLYANIITVANLAVLDPLDDTTQLDAATSIEVLQRHNDSHFRIRGGKLDQLDDVEIPAAGSPVEPVNNSRLIFKSSDGKWRPEKPAVATAAGQLFEIVFSHESTVVDAFITSDGNPSDSTPAVCGWDCRLAGLTFSNRRINADVDIEIYAVPAGAGTPTALNTQLKFEWNIRDTRTAHKTDFPASGPGTVLFNAGDKIAVFFGRVFPGTDPLGISLICHFIIRDFDNGEEVVDNWAGNIPAPPL